MMPSHSMDLPVPRGTSILMLGGRRKKNKTKQKQQQNYIFFNGEKAENADVCVTCSVFHREEPMVSFSPAAEVRPPGSFSK